ncbi:MAG TPA: hypothetical protein VGP31_14410 [Planosporangium sp.]|jgi:hypothetical protein|nr:hypothetical protein [Planosporangium sp.]
MWIAHGVPMVGLSAVLAGSAASPTAAASALDVVPVLTSTPFASPPGQAVTHTITLSGTGTGTATAVRVTFTTTVELDSVTASASPGTCPVVTALTVVCDLGNVDFTDANPPAPKVTIAGIVHAGASRGTLVQNLANVTLGAPDAGAINNVVSNAYLVSGTSAAPLPPPASAPALSAPPSDRAGRRLIKAAPVVAVVGLGLVTAALVVRWRRRRQQ